MNKMYNYLIILCAMAYTVAYLGRLNFTALIVDIIVTFDSTKEIVGLVGTFFFFAYGLGQLINGMLVKHYNVKTMVSISLVLSAVINIIMPLTSDISIMKYLWALNGIVQSILWPSIIRIMSDYLPAEYINKSIIVMSITVPIGTTLAYSISAIASFLGMWQIAFYVAAIALSVCAVCWWLCLGKVCRNISPIEGSCINVKNAETQLAVEAKSPKDRRQLGYIAIVIAIACIAGLGDNFSKDGIVTWVPSFLKDNYNLPSYFAILLTLLLPLVSVGGALIAQRLYKWIRDYFATGAILFAVSAIAIAVVTVVIDTSLAISIISLCVTSCVLAGINSIITSAIPFTLRGSVNSGQVAGIINSSCYIGSALATYLLGYVQEKNGWGMVFYVLLGVSVAGCAVMCLGVIARIINKKSSKSADEYAENKSSSV